MEQRSLFARIAAFAMLAAFLLPWAQVFGFGGSGYQITKLGSYANLAWLVPAGGAAYLILAFAGSPQRHLTGIAAGLLPWVALLYGISKVSTDLFQVLAIGAYITLAAGAALLVLSWSALRVAARTRRLSALDHIDPITVREAPPRAAALPPVDFGASLQSLLAKNAHRARVWAVDHDVSGWLRAHKIQLGSALVAIVALASLYNLVLKPNPSKDGQRTAEYFVACHTTYSTAVSVAYRNFLDGRPAAAFTRRADARQRLDQLLGDARASLAACEQAGNTQFGTMAARYRNAPTELGVFFAAAGSTAPVSPMELEQRADGAAEIEAILASIVAPDPDSARIVENLIGRTIDGWRFAYASEVKEVSLMGREFAGDTLTLKVNLSLQDYVSLQWFYAILDLVYSLDVDGQWEWQKLRQLVYDRQGFDYMIDGQIFLVGRWRWQSNYAVYHPNGLWEGRWDDGAARDGTWRIVSGVLVLTQGGQQVLSAPISSHTRDEILLATNPPARAERVK